MSTINQSRWHEQQLRAPEGHAAVREHFEQESLPFTVRIVHSEEELQKAIGIRHAAYARHLDADLADALKAPEKTDLLPGTVIFLAESKVDGTPLGTMRVQTNEFAPLGIERSFELPDWLKTERLAEATRLGVDQKMGVVVRTVLFKAYYWYCLLNNIRYMVITARRPIDRMYERLFFQDVFPGMGYVPVPHVFNLPHRILYFDVFQAEVQWRQRQHAQCKYMFDTLHPDLVLQ